MKTESFIKKIQPESDGLDFEGLRQEGIRLAQDVCGDKWTDYNLHDPGVTILEQACYGLTDLAYRTGFPVADYLASAGGDIDFKRLALHRPDDAFACRPITENDYRRLILDSVPNVENVWIRRDGGLYRVHLHLSERVKNQDNEGVRNAYAGVVRKLLAANRNLCEDLNEVRIAERVPYVLRGEIEIDGDRAPASILADIYSECAEYLSPGVTVRPYHEAHKSGISQDELFDGVVTRCGYIADAALHPWRGCFSIQELSGRIAGIAGVRILRRLEFVDREGGTTVCIELNDDKPSLPVACLLFPPPDGEAGVRLFRSDKACQAPMRDVEAEFGRLRYRHHALRNRKLRFDWVKATLPRGTFRQIGQYCSIQNHFPDIYGINADGFNASGIPASELQQRKADARQLKAYLLFFEQIMANFLRNAQEIPALFSLDGQPEKSYFHQVLNDGCVPDVESIYRYGVEEVDRRLAEMLASVDDYGDRRNRMLDYLLGLYGEEFGQNSLRHHFGEDIDCDKATIGNKAAFLKRIIDIGKNRAAAFDYRREPGGDNSSGLKRKLIVLLGLQGGEVDFELVEHVLLRSTADSPDGRNVPDDFYGFRISIVFPAEAGRYASSEFRKLVEETVSLNCPAHIHPEVLWLDARRLTGFETRHRDWLQAMRDGGASDETARALVQCLLDIGERTDG